MIKEEYVSFETAKLLKEKGFDELCDHFYRFDKPNDIFVGTAYKNSEIGDKYSGIYNTCTQQMATRWLREIKKIHCNVVVFSPKNAFAYGIYNMGRKSWCESDGGFYSTYEEASEAAIKYCLENLI